MIDLVSYINLDHRLDRDQHMRDTLRMCPFQVSRVSAIRLKTTPEQAGIKMKPGMEGLAGVASIFLSHKRALQQALKNGVEGSFVLLEDDVKVDFSLWSEEIVRYLPSVDFDVTFLTPRIKSRRGDNPQSSYFRKGDVINLSEQIKKNYITGAHFLIFKNRKSIGKALDLMENCGELFDVDVFYIRNLKCCGYMIDSVGVAGLGSDHKVPEVESTSG